jgi:hypothetical protein
MTYINSRSCTHIDVARDNDPFVEPDGTNSDVETEAEWFDEPYIEDVTQKKPLKTSEAMTTEVCLISLTVSIHLSFLYRGHHGRVLSALLDQVPVLLA